MKNYIFHQTQTHAANHVRVKKARKDNNFDNNRSDDRGRPRKPQMWGLHLTSPKTQECALGVSEVRSAAIISTMILNHINLDKETNTDLTTDCWSGSIACKFGEMNSLQVCEQIIWLKNIEIYDKRRNTIISDLVCK